MTAPAKTPEAAERPRRSGWLVADSAVTVLAMVLLGAAALALIPFGGLIGMQSDACGDVGVSCDYGVITAGAIIASWGPLALLLVAIPLTLRRMTRNRVACFIPLLGLPGVYGVLLIADAVVGSGIHRG
jgi:hypothetical protein